MAPNIPYATPLSAYAPAWTPTMFPIRDTRDYLPALQQRENDWVNQMNRDGLDNFITPESRAYAREVSGSAVPSFATTTETTPGMASTYGAVGKNLTGTSST